MGETVERARRGDAAGHEVNPERRAVLHAIAKYAGAAGVAGTFTVLSAEEVVAKKSCASHPNPIEGQNCTPSSSARSSSGFF